jgi:type VI protein secretion system component VasK
LRGLGDELRRNLFDQPIQEAWGVLLAETRRHLDALWQEQVYNFYQSKIAGHYPFEMTGTEDVERSDLEDFFHPTEGLLAVFQRDQLQVYLNNDWRGGRLGISRATQDAIEKARDIAEHVFEGDEVRVAFQLQPEQTELMNLDSPRPNFVQINIHDQNNYRYDQGGVRPWNVYRWPGFPQEARILVETQRGNYAKEEFGEWAWFKLLSQAQVNAQAPGQFRLSWVLGSNEYLVKYNLQYGDKASLFRDVGRFFNFTCPGSLF